MWGLGVSFYFMAFYQRVAPAVMTTELMRDFSIGAASLGNLSAFYFYAYMGLQIPTGVLADHWGPRKLLASGAVTAGIGSLIFALAPSLIWANLGRLLIGGGVAVAYVACLKLSAHWFPAKRFSLITGLALFWGLIGAVGAGVPLRLLVDHFGWRPVMLVSALVILALAMAAWVFIRDDPSDKGYLSYASARADSTGSGPGPLAGLKRVLGFRNTWLLACIPAGLAGPQLAFAGLWGVPYIMVRYQMAATEAAAVCSLMLVSMAVGGPLLGALTDHWGRRKPLYLVASLTTTIGWALVVFLPVLPLWGFVVITGLIGLASGAMIIGFAWGKESVPLHLAGTMAGVINMGTMLGPTILQPAIGLVLDAMWAGQIHEGVRVYSLEAYQVGLTLMVAWSLLSCALLLLAKETYCKQQG
jgi:MFS family permease